MIKRIAVLLIALVSVGIAFVVLLALGNHNPQPELGIGPIYTITLTVTGTPPTATTSSTITITPTPTLSRTITMTGTKTMTSTTTLTSTISPSSTGTLFVEKIQLVSPLNSSKISNSYTKFKWLPFRHAPEYTIEMQKMPKEIFVRKDVVTVCYGFVWWLPSEGEYRWRVTALNASGTPIGYSDWWIFTYGNPESTQISP